MNTFNHIFIKNITSDPIIIQKNIPLVYQEIKLYTEGQNFHTEDKTFVNNRNKNTQTITLSLDHTITKKNKRKKDSWSRTCVT